MGRIIKIENANRVRTQLMRSIILSIRELMSPSEPNQQTLDIAAYISLALTEIFLSIDGSVEAWEKRGYWIKADRYRQEWIWAENLGKAMRTAALEKDWGKIAVTAAQVAEKLKKVDVPKRNKIGTPWIGAFQRISK